MFMSPTIHPPHPTCLITPLLVLALLAVIGFGACAPAEPPPLPPGEPIAFGGRAMLEIVLPAGFVLKLEVGELFEVHHLWRAKPRSLREEASLGLWVGAFALPRCAGGKAVTPGAVAGIRRLEDAHWRRCGTSVPGLMARETFLSGGGTHVVHVFILGSSRAEMDVLNRIVATLRLL